MKTGESRNVPLLLGERQVGTADVTFNQDGTLSCVARLSAGEQLPDKADCSVGYDFMLGAQGVEQITIIPRR